MGLFDDAGIDPSELETGLTDGQHPAMLTEIKERHPAANVDSNGVQRYYMVFSWVTPDHDFPIKDFFEILPEGKTFADLDDTDDSYNVFTNPNTKKQVRQTEKRYFLNKYRQLKLYYTALGIPENKVNEVSTDDLLNLEAVITTRRNRQGYANIQSVSVPGSSGVTLPAPATNVSVGATTRPVANVNPFAR